MVYATDRSRAVVLVFFFLFCVALWFYCETFLVESYLVPCSHVFSVPFSIVITHLALFSLRTESDNPDATCEKSP